MTARLNELTAFEAATRIANGTLTAEALLRASLDRIAERESIVRAWTHLAAEAALAEARRLDRGPVRGPLHGLPVGVKDIIDTADMPTEYGSPIYAGHRPATDAASVALSREAGAIILGKTVTTEFAHRVPGPARNPLDPERTPGGSSSGSAAAVADFMVPLALGTQTTASTIRPASFCGVVGYRPTYGQIGCSGVRFCAESVDTLGIFARTVEDVAFYRSALLGLPVAPLAKPDAALRIGFCRTPFWNNLPPAAGTLFEDACTRLAAAGATVGEIDLPPEVVAAKEAHRVVSAWEFARNFTYERLFRRDQLSRVLLEGRIADGLKLGFDEYAAARATLEVGRPCLDACFESVDVLLTPAAAGEAPRGLQSTGSPVFSSLWTPLHVPTLTVPVFRGPEGMPVGAQVVGRRGGDARLFVAAGWIGSVLSG